MATSGSMHVQGYSGRMHVILAVKIGLLCSFGFAAETSSSRAALIASTETGWPQFRGLRRDGVSDERALLQSWPETGPQLIWSAKGAGRGFSSPIVSGGRIYLTGDFADELYVLAYDLQGKQLWRSKNGAAWLNQYQGARASVTFSAGRLYHQNAHGRLACLDAITGKEIWSVGVLERFGGENITWGLSECLVVDERAVYVTAGGAKAFVVALDKRNGEILWQTKPLLDPASGGSAESAGYAAPILVKFADRRLLIGSSSRHVFCVDVETGELQWSRPRPTSYSVLAMSPVMVGDAVFVTAPFGPPGALFRLIAPTQKDRKVEVEEVWTTDLDTAQGGVVHAGGRLFGSYYPRSGGWAAVDAASGKVLYAATQMVKGAGVYADNRLYALCEDGWMLLLNPTATEFEITGRFRVTATRDRDTWAHPVIHDARLYLRYHDNVYCYDIRATP